MEEEKVLIMPEIKKPVQERPAVKKTQVEHGNEIDEIISQKIPFVVRWGTVLFSSLLLLLTIMCWFIRYPDIISASATLNSVNAPRQVISRIDSKLVKIHVQENEEVEAGQVLGNMGSIANPESIMEVSQQLDSIQFLISKSRTDEIINFFPDYTNEAFMKDLGELQTPYQAFTQSFILFRDFLSSGFFIRKKKMLLADMENLQRLHKILSEQKALLQQDLYLSNETFSANESLAEDKIISSFDYRTEKSKLIAKQLSLPQINASVVLNESQQNEKKKELAELEKEINVQKHQFVQAVRTMKSQVQAWEYKYILKAPLAGRVSFISFFQENQEMKNGQPLFSVQPLNSSYFVEIIIPQNNFGKVKEGQQVLLKFKAYPYQQYGSVLGEIEYIHSIPTEEGYPAKVALPEGLLTNRNVPLQFKHGLLGQADIISEDMRLLERFYYDLSKQFTKF